MFDARIYRAAFIPLLLALVIVGFSLTGRLAGFSSTLAPDAFDGGRAFAGLQTLLERFPERSPGSAGDGRLAAYVAQTLRELGGARTRGSATGGFQVSTRRVRARTLDGARTLTTVVAERPGSTGEAPIAILASRDASERGSSAQLSATAALLELARVFAQSETRRTIVLVSTSGGSGEDASAAEFAKHAPQTLDAAIVLGDLAGTDDRKPFVLPFSSSSTEAPESLRLTLEQAISQEVGLDPGAPSVGAQLAHLTFPLPIGEQAPLNTAGVPAVLVGTSGEQGPAAGERVSESRLQGFGRAVLSATYALDEGPDVARPSGPQLLLGHKTLPGWTIRLLVLVLLLPPLVVSVDALARLRRRHEKVSRWIVWTLMCAAPPLVCALFARLLGALGLIDATAGQLSAGWLSAKGSPLATALLAALLALSLLAWPALPRGLSLPLRPDSGAAGVATMLVLLGVALLTWIFNPFACLLLIPALHAWPLALASEGPDSPPRPRLLALGAILLGTIPLLLLLLAYSHALGFGVADMLEGATLLVASGQVGIFGTLSWSISLGCLLAVVLLALRPRPGGVTPPPDWHAISTRGPVSYAGPGSLGGTESALRR
jgi:hypothetical protein